MLQNSTGAVAKKASVWTAGGWWDGRPYCCFLCVWVARSDNFYAEGGGFLPTVTLTSVRDLIAPP
jgi:hypothetical protein